MVLADPLGYAFISVGIDCTYPGASSRVDIVKPLIKPEIYNNFDYDEFIKKEIRENSYTKPTFINFAKNNLVKAFGSDWKYKWATITKKIYNDALLNTIGNWSSSYFINNSQLPYVIPLAREKEYPSTKLNIFRDFPDVFHNDFSKSSLEFASTLIKYRDDPYMIGYFMRNEPTWALEYDLVIANQLLGSPHKHESKTALIKWLKNKYTNIDSLNIAWKSNLKSFEELYLPKKDWSKKSTFALSDLKTFSSIMIRRYVEIPAKACKSVDKNHLNLGMRWAYIHDKILLSGIENYDVFSINCYEYDPVKKINDIGKQTNLPIIIGEFHHGALDGSTTATGIYSVKTQKDRVKAYRYYLEKGLITNYLIGAHYFQWMDQPPLGRHDGENYNIGLVDQLTNPYKCLVEAMNLSHGQMYDVAEGKVEPYNISFEKIPSIFY